MTPSLAHIRRTTSVAALALARKISPTALVVGLLAAVPVAAQDVTIVDGQTVTTAVILANEGDALIIEQGGALDVAIGDAAFGDADNQVFTNSGTITAGSDGIDSSGDNSVITNSGTITASNGVLSDGGDNSVITNSGTITASNGVLSDGGDNSVITNSGTITASNGVFSNNSDNSVITNSGTITASNGVFSNNSDNSVITNSGTITASAQGVFSGAPNSNAVITNSGEITADTDGIFSLGDTAVVTNSGTITAGFDGIDSRGGSSVIINSGEIEAGVNGIRSSGDNAVITNSGTIRGGTFAIVQQSADDTLLTLNAGSILIGRVDLGGGVNTLNIGQGLSLNATFESEGGASLVQLGTTGGQLVALVPVAGSATNEVQVVTVDPSAFANFDATFAALTSGIGGVVQGRQLALRSDPALGFASRYDAAEENDLAAFSDLNLGSDLDDTPHLNPNRFWIEGFGAYRQEDGDRVSGEFESLTGGLVAGVDVPLDALTSIGAMAGFAVSTSETENDTQSTDATSFYAGAYASTQALGLAWDASLTVGYTDYDQDRITANNLVAGGLETANADFGGWFINPQITATNSTPTGFVATSSGFGLRTIEQSLTLSYAGLFLDGYTETGTSNPLTLDDRDIHLASARAALALPFERIEADGALTTVRLIGGVEARTQFGDGDVSGTLLGQSVTTTLDDDDAAFGGFLGLSGEHQTTTGLTAYARAEALLETDSAYQLSATAGMRIAF